MEVMLFLFFKKDCLCRPYCENSLQKDGGKEMDQSTMIKIIGSEGRMSLRTISRTFRSPHSFIVLNKDLEKLEKEKHLIVKDILSFAELRYCEDKDQKKVIKITFWWMEGAADQEYTVQRENVCLPYDAFRLALQQPGSEQRMLSVSKQTFPKFEFQSRKHLKEIVKQPGLKHKFTKFLVTKMHWANYERIVLYDDFMPYSFVFDGYTPYGVGLCGGIILHGQEQMETSYYCIHT